MTSRDWTTGSTQVGVQEATTDKAASTDIDTTAISCSGVYLQTIDELDDALFAVQLVDNSQDIKTHQ